MVMVDFEKALQHAAVDPLKFDELEKDATIWIDRICSIVKLTTPAAASRENFLGTGRNLISKEALAQYLVEGLNTVIRQNKLIVHLREQAQVLKSDVISCQKSVIQLQKELLVAKDQQLNALQTAVEASVDTVKTEIKSYSEAVNRINQSPVTSSAIISEQSVKRFVKQVVAEEDRSRNLMIFSLPESGGQELYGEVNKLFEQLGEKPKIEACRLGKKGSSARPVRVTLSSSTIVQQILGKARDLRESEDYKEVFLSADRSVEERTLHKQLVQQLRTKREEEPGRKHYIRGGQVCSADT
jgi:hypothetical protein